MKTYNGHLIYKMLRNFSNNMDENMNTIKYTISNTDAALLIL